MDEQITVEVLAKSVRKGTLHMEYGMQIFKNTRAVLTVWMDRTWEDANGRADKLRAMLTGCADRNE